MKNTISILFGMVLSVVLPAFCYADGLNKVIVNPSPDRTWTDQMGGLFHSAKSYAVVISISDYVGKEKGGYPKLATHKDAEKMASFLLQDMGFDYVHVLTDTEVTKKNLETIMLDEIRTIVGQNDRFVFYWSGHGDRIVRPDTSTSYGFLPLYDSRVGVISSMISMEDISRWNRYLEARHALFILDACLSGLAGVNAKDDPRLDQLSLPARFLLTAGTANEEAVVGDRWGGSLFTDALIKIAKENAQTSDAVISIYKIFDDLQRLVAVEKQNSNWQKTLTPQLRDLEGGGGTFFFVGKRLPQKSLQTAELFKAGAQAANSKSATTAQIASKAVEDKKGPPQGSGPRDANATEPNRSTDNGSIEKQLAMISNPKLDQTAAKDTAKVVDHCKPSQQIVNTVKASSALSLSDAFRVHLGEVPLINYQRSRISAELSNTQPFDLSGVLRKFQTKSLSISKCGGRTLLVSYLLSDGSSPVATVYVGFSTACDGAFDMKDAFEGIISDMRLSPMQPDSAIVRRSVDLGDSVLSYAMDTSKTNTCSGIIVHAAKGYK